MPSLRRWSHYIKAMVKSLATIVFGFLLLIFYQNCGFHVQDPQSLASQNSNGSTLTPEEPGAPSAELPPAEPQQPTPPPAPSFKSVTVLTADEYAPKSDPGQRVEFSLHASGGGVDTFGTAFQAVTPIEMGYKDEMPFFFNLRNAANYMAPPYIAVRPRDFINRDDGTKLETWWFGFARKPAPAALDQTVYAYNYTEVRVDALYKWFFKNYPQADPKKVILRGQSMGAWGSMTYGLRRSHMFAAIFVTLPRWRQTMIANFDGPSMNAGEIRLPTGEKYIDRMDMIAFINNASHKIPFIAWAIGKQDGFASFESQIEAVNALRATKRGFVFSWNNGNHSEGVDAFNAIAATYTPDDFALGKGYPIFMNSSLDDDPVKDLEGGINLGFKWQKLVETETGFEVEVSNTLGTVEVDMIPHSEIFKGTKTQKHITIPSGQWIKVSW